jgi:NAD(P)-dependent dehydrogenase (short-subunit alcohol dehydrogenase family)
MQDRPVALITGANKGLGFEIARQLGAQGFTVVLGARQEALGAAACRHLREEGLDAHGVQLDVTRAEDVAALPGFLGERFGRLDVLVNNAGVGRFDAPDDLDTFLATFAVNVHGAVAVTYAVLPLLQAAPAGRIVNQSSILGSLGSLTQAPDSFQGSVSPAYTASKAALNGFTVALAHKLRGTQVKVNAAHPGWVKTDMGGAGAPMDVATGAKTAVALATLGATGPSGLFFHLGKALPW